MNIKDNKKEIFGRSDIMEKIIKNCRRVKRCDDGLNKLEKEKQRKTKNFGILLGFKENEIYERKEYSIVKRIRKIFKSQIINEQYRVKNYFIDLVFPVHKLGVEIDENGHIQKSKIKEQEREQTIKEETGFHIIITNPNKENFDIDDKIGEIQDFIYKSGLELSKQSAKNKIVEDTEKLTKIVKQFCV